MSATREDRELRAKYLDWCSARLADRFLALSPDEIYELAERASHGREDAFVASGASGIETTGAVPARTTRQRSTVWSDPDSFRILVARVTEVLADTLRLPDYDEWVRAYREAPAGYNAEMIGFWRETAGK